MDHLPVAMQHPSSTPIVGPRDGGAGSETRVEGVSGAALGNVAASVGAALVV